MELDHSLHWLGLALAPGLASRLTAKLLRNFGSPEAVFGASLTELEACQLPAPAAQAIRSQDPLKAAAKELDQLKKLGCRLVNWGEPEYPKRLLEIYDPPPLLYVRGDPQVLTRHSISIVGRSEEHTSELQSRLHLVCRLLLEKKKKTYIASAGNPW